MRGVIFDKDGTLFDFHATWAAWCAAVLATEAPEGGARRQAMADVLGYDPAAGRFHPDSIVIGHTAGEVVAALMPWLPGEDPARVLARLDALAHGQPQRPAADLADLLGRLRAAGLKIGLATNDTEAAARAHLTQAGVLDLFDFVAGYDSGHGGKPAPGQLLAFAAAFGLAPADCAMVGDSLHDLHAARAAGMAAVGVLTGLAGRGDLAPAADVVLDSIAGLPGWLGISAG